MTVGEKLTICITGMLAVVPGLAGAGWYSNRNVGNLLTYATQTVAWRAILAGELRGELVDLRAKHFGMLTYTLTHEDKRAEANRAHLVDELRSMAGRAA